MIYIKMMVGVKPLVSVVIVCKNEQKNIANCLESVESQDCQLADVEIIVVDNNSDDGTAEIAKRYTELVFDFGPERSAQRNLGVKNSSGKYVLYLDADMILSAGVINECVNRMEEDESLMALYIPEIIRGGKMMSNIRKFERSFYDATVVDAVRFMRKDIFLKVGGFDESLTGPEDWDLDKRIRNLGEVGIIKSPLYHNEENISIIKYLGKKSYYGHDFAKYIAKWGHDDPDIKKQFGFVYRFFGVFCEKGKWKKLISHPLLALGMYALRILVGIRFLLGKI